MDKSGQGQKICLEKIAQTNHLFQISYPYASGSLSQQLVALHALFGCLDQVVVNTSDDYVAHKKLDWWRTEIRLENMVRSRHPVLNYLQETGAASLLPARGLTAILDATETILAARAPASVDELRQLCCEIYQPRMDLESALTQGAGILPDRQRIMASNSGLALLIMCSARNLSTSAEALWWVPLNLLAREGINRTELFETPDSIAAQALFREVYSSLN